MLVMVAAIESYTKNLKNVGQFLQTKTAGSNTTRSQLGKYVNWLKALQKDKKADIHIICKYASGGDSNRDGYPKTLQNVGQLLQTTGSNTTRQWMQRANLRLSRSYAHQHTSDVLQPMF